ncbi:hypothetical protein J4727_13210 [Providencia rettgeri]|uniref:Uncharacterized protein n=1 Tax=Providencia rettgeri TaxID=587 RepID=A0A939NCK4_PRORE|nr:hypothetical protein [Providencia rettgeri]
MTLVKMWDQQQVVKESNLRWPCIQRLPSLMARASLNAIICTNSLLSFKANEPLNQGMPLNMI